MTIGTDSTADVVDSSCDSWALEDDNIFLHHQDLALRNAAWNEEEAQEPTVDGRSSPRIQPRAWQRQLFLPSGADVTVSAYRNWSISTVALTVAL